MKWIDLINLILAVSGLVVALLSILLNHLMPFLDLWTKRFFVILFSNIFGYIAADLISQISLVFLGENYALLSKTAVFFESLLSSFLMILMNIFLLHCAGEEWKKNRSFFAALLIWFMYFCMLCDTQITGVFYQFTDDNKYLRGELYPVLLVPPVALMLYNLVVYFRHYNAMSGRYKKAVAINLALPVIGMLIQMFHYGLLMIVICTSLGALIMFIYMMVDSINHHIDLINREAKQQANIAVLQMRPHFIYNTLTSIYYLCSEDPKAAMDAILNFSNYLRLNFTAIVSENVIPFKEELSHVKAYLQVEKTRFPEWLFVKYDITCTDFKLPPLCIQPLVENSVKHGLDPEEDPLQIVIRTEENEDSFKVTVEDTGAGIDDYTRLEGGLYDGNHIAIDNIKKRLDMMCGGTLTFSERDEGGTIAVIKLPKSANMV